MNMSHTLTPSTYPPRSRTFTERDKAYDTYYGDSIKLWSKLAVCPDKEFAIPRMMNKNAIIVPVHDALLTYNISQNKWMEFYKYPQEIRFKFGKHRIQILYFNSKTNRLYILATQRVDARPDFMQINMKTNQHQKLSNIVGSRPSNYHCIEIGNNFHIFTQNRFTFRLNHILFNKNLNNYTEINKFNDFEVYQGIIYLKSKQMILLITMNHIHSYQIRRNKWNLMNITFPKKLKDELINGRIKQFAYCMDKSEQFIILFTGFIWIIDLLSMKVVKSKIVCPLRKGRFHCVVTNEDVKDELICNGYIRENWNYDKQCTLQILPMYLIKLIQSFYSDQIIHLFETYAKIGHWKIKMNDILLNVC